MVFLSVPLCIPFSGCSRYSIIYAYLITVWYLSLKCQFTNSLWIQVKYRNLASLYLLLYPIYSKIALNTSCTYTENRIKPCYNFCFNHQHNLENSRKESLLYLSILLVFLLFFLTYWSSKNASFILFTLFRELPLAILLGCVYWLQILFIFFDLRMSWLPPSFRRHSWIYL